VHGVRDLDTPEDLKVHVRGNPMRLGETVPRGFVSVLGDADRARFSAGSGRLELARAIVAEPIASRVLVNRIWKEHFGTGLVNTPSNFGKNGERPTHPELLDYLAQYFIDHQYSVKALQREILRSRVYGLSTASEPAAAAKDSGNRLYWHANRRRLPAEQIRDAVLFVSGALDSRIGGPATPLTPLNDRRTVYGKVSRYKLDEFLQLFDFPSPSQTAEQRFSTTVPLQRLFLMNSDFMQQHAERLAERVADEADDTARIARTYRLLFGRAPSPEETATGLTFLRAEAAKQYEERRMAKAAAQKDDGGKDPVPPPAPAEPTAAEGGDAPAMDENMGEGMMAGVTPGAKLPAGEAAKMKPVTTFGRYVKVLLSSNEFLYVN
jgi:plasmid stability protein